MGGRTSGTRPKGSGIPAGGDGWGGPPKGAGKPVAEWAGRPPGMKDGEGKQSVADLLAALDARAKIAEAWMAIINDPTNPHHATMLAKGTDRLDGLAVATTINANINDTDGLTRAELDDEIARARREVAALGSGEGAADSGDATP